MQGIVSSEHLACLIQYFTRYGVNYEKAIHYLGLERYGTCVCEFPEVISLEEFISACSRANHYSDDPLFTLKAGMVQSTGDFSLLAQLVFYSADLQQALSYYVEYVEHFNSGFAVDCLYNSREVIYPVISKGYSHQDYSAFMELRLATCIRLIRLITGEQSPDIISAVSFRHKAKAPLVEYQRILDTEVRFQQDKDSFAIVREYYKRPIIGNDKAQLNQTLEKIRKRIADLQLESPDLVTRVRSLIRTGLPINQFSQKDIAAKMEVSVSTLKRQLEIAGSSFQQLIDEERKEIADHLIKNTAISMEDIAQKAGYSSPSAFTRGYFRISGANPRDVRRRFERS